MNFIQKAIDFWHLRNAWLGDKGEPVSRELAENRANTCLECPKHDKHPFWELLSGLVVMETRRQLEVKRSLNLQVENEENLHVCNVCWCVLKLKVWCPLKHVLNTTDAKTKDSFPPNCWIVQESRKEEKLHEP